MDDKAKARVQEAVSLTRGQLGIGGAVVTAMLILNPVKQWFFTREEGVAHSKEIADLKHSQEDQFKELKSFIIIGQENEMHKLERLNDKVIERIKDAEDRAVQNDARSERRLDVLEEAVLNRPKFRKTN